MKKYEVIGEGCFQLPGLRIMKACKGEIIEVEGLDKIKWADRCGILKEINVNTKKIKK